MLGEVVMALLRALAACALSACVLLFVATLARGLAYRPYVFAKVMLRRALRRNAPTRPVAKYESDDEGAPEAPPFKAE